MHADMKRRWVHELVEGEKAEVPGTKASKKRKVRKHERLRKLIICTLLDPRFRRFRFKGSDFYDKNQAFQWFREEYLANWAPKTVHDEELDTDEVAKGKRKKCALTNDDSDISSDDESDGEGICSDDEGAVQNDDSDADACEDESDTGRLNEITVYLAGKQLENIPEFDLLEWWFARRGEYPHLSKMMRQFLASPASSAGVERLFNGAGKMHADDSQRMKSETIKNALLTAENYNPWSVM